MDGVTSVQRGIPAARQPDLSALRVVFKQPDPGSGNNLDLQETSDPSRCQQEYFNAIDRELSKHGYIARGSQMIDASIMQAPMLSLSKEEKAVVRGRRDAVGC